MSQCWPIDLKTYFYVINLVVSSNPMLLNIYNKATLDKICVHCILLYIVQCTMYNVHCTLYNNILLYYSTLTV